ncbi:hypothetical protein BDZ97DRAFT_2081922, partial [Flammula alnicola]
MAMAGISPTPFFFDFRAAVSMVHESPNGLELQEHENGVGRRCKIPGHPRLRAARYEHPSRPPVDVYRHPRRLASNRQPLANTSNAHEHPWHPWTARGRLQPTYKHKHRSAPQEHRQCRNTKGDSGSGRATRYVANNAPSQRQLRSQSGLCNSHLDRLWMPITTYEGSRATHNHREHLKRPRT